MTITSTATTFETTGNGSDTSFIFNYPIHKTRDLIVYAAGTLRALNDSTYGHTISIAADKQTATVVFATAPANTIALKFEREVEYKQESDLTNNSLFDAESLETTLDNIVMQLQQVGNIVTSTADSRTFSFDGGIQTSDYNTTPSAASTLNSNKAARVGKALMFDATTGDITVSGDNLDTTIDYQLEAKEWASLASGNVYSYDGGTRDADQGSISAKAQAAAAAADAATVATLYDNFDDRYLGVHTTAERESGSQNIGKDHDGIALVEGALYYDSDKEAMMVWDTNAWVQMTPSSANQANINTVITNPLAANITLVANIDGDVTKVADIDDKVEDVADIDDKVTTVALAIGDVSDVAAVDAEIARLGTPAMSTATSGHLARLGVDALTNLSTGYLKKVSDISTHVETVSGIHAAVSGVNTISAQVTAVNLDAVDIGKVATIDTEVGKVAAIDTEINNIGTDAYSHADTGYIKLVALDATDIGLCATRATEIGLLGTVAMASGASAYLAVLGTPAMTHVSTGYLKKVADINDKVIIVAGDTTAIGTIHTDLSGDDTIGTVATNLEGTDTIGTVAGSIADVNRYANEYKIQGTAPGGATEGDIWMDSTAHVFKVHNGTTFVTVTEGQTAAEVTAEATAQAISMSIALG